jgi:hypothetical protein
MLAITETSMDTRLRIFLAHASDDKAAVRALHAQLTQAGLQPWLDEMDLVPGLPFDAQIRQAIRDCVVFLACLSQVSVAKSGYVQKEFRFALDVLATKPPGTLFLIPVKLDDCVIPDLAIPNLGVALRDIHSVNLSKEDGFAKLVAAIEHAIEQAITLQGVLSSAKPTDLGANEKRGLSVRGDAMVGIKMLWDIADNDTFEVMDLHLRNSRIDKTFDDVLIRLRLPAHIAFVSKTSIPGPKHHVGEVMLTYPHPAHPKTSFDLGYLRRYVEPGKFTSGWFGATRNINEIEWSVSARNTPPTSGTIDISRLRKDQ